MYWGDLRINRRNVGEGSCPIYIPSLPFGVQGIGGAPSVLNRAPPARILEFSNLESQSCEFRLLLCFSLGIRKHLREAKIAIGD